MQSMHIKLSLRKGLGTFSTLISRTTAMSGKGKSDLPVVIRTGICSFTIPAPTTLPIFGHPIRLVPSCDQSRSCDQHRCCCQGASPSPAVPLEVLDTLRLPPDSCEAFGGITQNKSSLLGSRESVHQWASRRGHSHLLQTHLKPWELPLRNHSDMLRSLQGAPENTLHGVDRVNMS